MDKKILTGIAPKVILVIGRDCWVGFNICWEPFAHKQFPASFIPLLQPGISTPLVSEYKRIRRGDMNTFVTRRNQTKKSCSEMTPDLLLKLARLVTISLYYLQ